MVICGTQENAIKEVTEEIRSVAEAPLQGGRGQQGRDEMVAEVKKAGQNRHTDNNAGTTADAMLEKSEEQSMHQHKP